MSNRSINFRRRFFRCRHLISRNASIGASLQLQRSLPADGVSAHGLGKRRHVDAGQDEQVGQSGPLARLLPLLDDVVLQVHILIIRGPY